MSLYGDLVADVRAGRTEQPRRGCVYGLGEDWYFRWREGWVRLSVAPYGSVSVARQPDAPGSLLTGRLVVLPNRRLRRALRLKFPELDWRERSDPTAILDGSL